VIPNLLKAGLDVMTARVGQQEKDSVLAFILALRKMEE